MRSRLFFITVLWLILPVLVEAGTITVDFETGEPPSSLIVISALTPTTSLDFTGGKMNITMNNVGDGVFIDPQVFNPECALFSDLSLEGFSQIDEGVNFDIIFGTATDTVSIKLTRVGAFTTRIRIIENLGGAVENELETSIIGFGIDQIQDVQLDWIGENMIAIEITPKVGEKATQKATSNITHDPNKKTAYRIKSTITQDPIVSVGEISLSTQHVPEPSTLLLLSSGLVGFGVAAWRRARQKESSTKRENRS